MRVFTQNVKDEPAKSHLMNCRRFHTTESQRWAFQQPKPYIYACNFAIKHKKPITSKGSYAIINYINCELRFDVDGIPVRF